MQPVLSTIVARRLHFELFLRADAASTHGRPGQC
jgi:hypothetical protein